MHYYDAAEDMIKLLQDIQSNRSLVGCLEKTIEVVNTLEVLIDSLWSWSTDELSPIDLDAVEKLDKLTTMVRFTTTLEENNGKS